ncbi:hypothetical protein F4677DRAFT_439043 [Hypoxylon crocopeplum]|nr:hypothetical protein F4677DRAFT_439043 [Hypoxylon crocopeplum]
MNNSLIIFLSSIVDEAPAGTVSIEQIYSAMQLIAMRHRDLHIYPNATEMRQDRFKIGDIRALDMIAQKSEDKFAFRPRTCLGNHPCMLGVYDGNEQNVVKSSHSCDTHGVQLYKKAEAQVRVGCWKGDLQDSISCVNYPAKKRKTLHSLPEPPPPPRLSIAYTCTKII